MGEGKGQEAIDHMAIDQERAFLNKKFFRDAKDPKLLAAIESMLDEHAIAINIGQLCQILRAYAAECVRVDRQRLKLGVNWLRVWQEARLLTFSEWHKKEIATAIERERL